MHFNFQNTTDEDSMVVQYILAVRKGRREVKPEAAKPVSDTEVKKEETGREETVKVEEDKMLEGTDVNTIQPSVQPIPPVQCEKTADVELVNTVASVKPEEPVAATGEPSKPKTEPQFIEVEEYYVKYRNFSYLHCEWKTEDELYKGDKRIAAKLKRFKQKMSHHANIFENVSRKLCIMLSPLNLHSFLPV